MSMDEEKRRTDSAPTRRAVLRGMGAAAAGAALGPAVWAADTPQPSRDAIRIPAWYYQHFDADHSLDVPEEGFGGWKKAPLDFARHHTAVVDMHAWEAGRAP